MAKCKGQKKPRKRKLPIIIDDVLLGSIQAQAVTVGGPSLQAERDLWLAELEALRPLKRNLELFCERACNPEQDMVEY